MSKRSPFKYDFFVSYTTREDEVRIIKPFVEKFIGRIGFGCAPFWLDLLQIGRFDGYDDALRDELRNAISECRAMIAFISPGYWTSDFCRFEFEEMLRTSPEREPFLATLEWKGRSGPGNIPAEYVSM